MNIADDLNLFLFKIIPIPVRDPATHLISEAGQTIIYSAVNEVTISNKTGCAICDHSKMRVKGAGCNYWDKGSELTYALEYILEDPDRIMSL